MELADRFSVSQDVVSRKVGGEIVLLDLESGQYFGLDLVGGRVWTLLAEQAQSLSELSREIEKEFDAPLDVIEADILAIAKEMREQGLIVEAGR
ncbi:PqqD family protein [Erythrobacter sp. THAF29]|uniref:PqqD family protein n=1 Tax=Erythrobacter sp. THAF29 TaxID=2587851 RepID=UPI0012AA94D5|nr:PqqD family protein [Erythrobacter sp. THAF29]QFT75983.1 hypothetical protein FIU90_00370 [Erythrobacter sp. THAF29]